MKKHDKLVLIGAGGHGKVCAEIAALVGYKEICFLDDNKSSANSDNLKIYGNILEYINFINDADFFISIGNNEIRRNFYNILVKNGANITTLIHPSASVSPTANIGNGTVIMGGAVINASVDIGECVIINTCSSVDHDCKVGDFSHISVGAHLSGTVSFGNNSILCIGAVISNNIYVCDNCIIGAGAVVITDIIEAGVYVGVPAKKIK